MASHQCNRDVVGCPGFNTGGVGSKCCVQVGDEIGEQDAGILTVACATVVTGERLAATGIFAG